MEIINLRDYINKAAWIVESGQYKRIDYILKLGLSQEDYNEFKRLIKWYKYEELFEKFEDRLRFNIHPFSSDVSDHVVTVDGKDYYTVGSEEQFNSQFTYELREQRLRDLLDNNNEDQD